MRDVYIIGVDTIKFGNHMDKSIKDLATFADLPRPNGKDPARYAHLEKELAERPDAILPTLGGQTGLNCAARASPSARRRAASAKEWESRAYPSPMLKTPVRAVPQLFITPGMVLPAVCMISPWPLARKNYISPTRILSSLVSWEELTSKMYCP